MFERQYGGGLGLQLALVSHVTHLGAKRAETWFACPQLKQPPR